MLVENQSSKGIALAVQEVLPQAKVYILDPQNDGVHLEAIVIAKEFETLSLLQQHQMVMKALKAHFSEDLHALGLKTLTPQSWEKQKHHYL
jgi:acid stress-induced BolA-like protein IbaG/YrbA